MRPLFNLFLGCIFTLGSITQVFAQTVLSPQVQPTRLTTDATGSQSIYNNFTQKPAPQLSVKAPTPHSAEPLPNTPGGRLLAELGRSTITTPGERELAFDSAVSYTDPLNWAVTVYKSRHELVVYYKGRMFKTYRAVFGRYPDPGPKLYEGDLRTPEGVYVIVGKYPHKRWRRFLKLNYPNAVDRQHHAEAVSEGLVPIWNGRPAPIGGAVGIHGTDAPWLNRSNINWTAGCISVDNDSILELDKLLPVGTLVVIKP